MYRTKVNGVDTAYLHNMTDADRLKLRDAMRLTEKGRKYLQGMEDTAKIRQEFGGVFSIPYEDYVEFMES